MPDIHPDRGRYRVCGPLIRESPSSCPRLLRAQCKISGFHDSPLVIAEGIKHLQIANCPDGGTLQLQRVPGAPGFAITETRKRIPSSPMASLAAISDRAAARDSKDPSGKAHHLPCVRCGGLQTRIKAISAAPCHACPPTAVALRVAFWNQLGRVPSCAYASSSCVVIRSNRSFRLTCSLRSIHWPAALILL
jgi:hypothetical protein